MSTIDEIMAAVFMSQVHTGKFADGSGSKEDMGAADQHVHDLIAAALADAERKGSEAMREAAACVCDLNHSNCRERCESKTGDSEDEYQAEMAKECAQEIRALPLPTGGQS